MTEDTKAKGLAALKAWRESGGATERLTPTERAARNPKSKTMAIKAMCYECSGAQTNEIKYCSSTKCPLYYLRPYQDKAKSNTDINEEGENDERTEGECKDE